MYANLTKPTFQQSHQGLRNSDFKVLFLVSKISYFWSLIFQNQVLVVLKFWMSKCLVLIKVVLIWYVYQTSAIISCLTESWNYFWSRILTGLIALPQWVQRLHTLNNLKILQSLATKLLKNSYAIFFEEFRPKVPSLNPPFRFTKWDQKSRS